MDQITKLQGQATYQIIRVGGQLFLIFPEGFPASMALDVQELLTKIDAAKKISEQDTDDGL